jgi:hypothetical protein
MKKLTVLLFAFVAFSSISLSASAENAPGNVDFYAFPQNSMLKVGFDWWDNDSGNYIQTFLYWDTIFTNNPRFADSSQNFGTKYYDKDGRIEFFLPQFPCHTYYLKLVGVDGKSGKPFTLYRYALAPGLEKPSFGSDARMSKISFKTATFQTSISTSCSYGWFHLQVGALNETDLIVDEYGQIQQSETFFERDFKGLEPNKIYNLYLEISNDNGVSIFYTQFKTESNLPPVIESLRSSVISPSIAHVISSIDAKNTTSTDVRIEYGEQISLENLSDWSRYFGKGNYAFTIENLKPNTVYFWRPVARNDFGQDEGQTKMFKTNEFATAVTEITSDDLLQVSSCPAGIRIYPEKDAIVEIYSITGQKVLTTNLNGGEAHIFSSLTPGMYIVKSSIEGYTVTKKALVN